MPFTPDELARALAVLALPAPEALQVVSAEVLAGQYYPHLDPSQPALVLNASASPLPAQIKPTLLQVYPPQHRLTLLTGGGRDVREVTLAALGEDDQATALFIPPLPGACAYAALQDIAARLRAPDGCPWDRALTWETLRPSLLEETYELLAALDAGDPNKVLEEQGDLLLQVALQAQIATEAGHFRLPDVIARIVDKLIRRHPHVFGDTKVSGTEEVLANWEAIKAAERAQNGEKRSASMPPPLAGIPVGLPALAQAQAYLDRMSRLRAAVPPETPWASLANLPPDTAPTDEMLGETLFGLVAWAMARGLDVESALRQANARFAAQVAAEGWH